MRGVMSAFLQTPAKTMELLILTQLPVFVQKVLLETGVK